MKPVEKYTFISINSCNMCGSDKQHHKITGIRLNQSQGKKPLKKSGISISIKKCKKCGLLFSDPLPMPENIQDHYNIQPESYWKEEYFVIQQNYFRNEIQILQTLLPYSQRMKTLDIGAGLGKQMLALSDLGYDTYGIEPSHSFYEMAIRKMGIPKDTLFNTPIESAVFEDNFFDFISFGAVLEHLYFPSEAIETALKWLKPGGIIHIEVPSADWLTSKIVNLYYKISCSGYVSNLSPMHEPFHLYEFTKKSFEINAIRQKYEIAYFQYFVCNTYLPRIFDFFLKPYMKKTNKGMQLTVWLRKI